MFELCGNAAVSLCLQKAIMECDEEWAMNKKVVDLSSKDIRRAVCPLLLLLLSVISITFLVLSSLLNVESCSFNASQVPRGLPYFAVDFGLQGGFAHVIENEQKFPHYFGKVSVCIKAFI